MENNLLKILVTGSTGQLGYDVVRQGLERNLNVIGVGSNDLDITDEKRVNEYINQLNPDAIIHCAAYTAVDKAEDDRETCWNVNVEGTRYLVKAAKNVGAKFIYISTDYVFDGEGSKPFNEQDTPNPIGYYGLTKYNAEEIVKQELDRWFIVRISWVFGINGNNFIKTMLKLAEIKSTLNIVGDQYGSPTYTFDLSKLLIDMIESNKYGIYHASNEGFCNWGGFANEIFAQNQNEIEVNLVTTEEYPTRAVRPKNSKMSKIKLLDSGFHPLPTWQDAIKRYLKELKQEVK